MLVEAFPRLAVRLQSIFPDAQVKLETDGTGLSVSLPTFPKWEVLVRSREIAEGKDQFQIIESSVALCFESLNDIPEIEFLRLLAAENRDLRGVSVVHDPEFGRRGLRVRTSFLGQKGRTRDEAENLAIDAISLLRFCRLIEDRIQRSTAGYDFSFELYHSTYLHKSAGLYRYVNYARHIFEGSHERLFGQLMSMLKKDYSCQIRLESQEHSARVLMPNTMTENSFRLPKETPSISASALVHPARGKERETLELVSRLNSKIHEGHFELSADSKQIYFVAWKHLTNDLRFYSLDHLLHRVQEASELLRAEMHGESPAPTQRDLTSAPDSSARLAA